MFRNKIHIYSVAYYTHTGIIIVISL